MKSITKILKGTLAVILLLCVTACGKSQAKIDFEEAVTALEAKNQELDSAISDLWVLLESEDRPLDLTLLERSEALIENADAVKILPPEMGKGEEVIGKQASELNAVDYSTVITEHPELIFYGEKDSFLYDLFKYRLTKPHECEMILKYKGHFFIGA